MVPRATAILYARILVPGPRELDILTQVSAPKVFAWYNLDICSRTLRKTFGHLASSGGARRRRWRAAARARARG
eukprot:COSAG01_NODE_13159_length_1626_cov_91.907662_1_plen_73_part_10